MFFVTTGFSQTYLTNGQVYDFNIGDIIQGRFHSSGPFGSLGPPMYQTRTIIGKLISINSDTIFYTIKIDYYTPPTCPTCNPTFSSDTIIQTVTDLALAPNHYNQTTCLGTQDTIYLDFCNRQVWERHPNIDTGCFEPTTHTTQFIEGIGGPFFSKCDPQGPLWTEFLLVYYQKYPDNCGTLVTSIKEEKNSAMKIETFPNPASDIIQIESPEKFVYFDIIGLSGQVYISTKFINNSIDISGLQTGTYLINFYTSDYKIVTKKIQKL